MNRIVRSVDALSEWTGRFSAWIFFVIGLCITYEVLMRYVFTAPTIWVDEVARVMQIWAAYLGAAYVFKHRKMITIEVILKDPSTVRRRLAETLAIIMLMVFVVPASLFRLPALAQIDPGRSYHRQLSGFPEVADPRVRVVGVGVAGVAGGNRAVSGLVRRATAGRGRRPARPGNAVIWKRF